MAASHAPHEIPVQHEAVDSWHQHDLSTEDGPQHEHAAKINPVVLFAAFVGLSVVTACLVGVVTMYYYAQVTSVGGLTHAQDWESMNRLAKESEAYSQEADRSLSNYEWVNAETGAVSVPMETAYERVMQKYSTPAAADAKK